MGNREIPEIEQRGGALYLLPVDLWALLGVYVSYPLPTHFYLFPAQYTDTVCFLLDGMETHENMTLEFLICLLVWISFFKNTAIKLIHLS